MQALESIKASFEIGSVSRFVSAAGPGTHSLLPKSCIIHKKVSPSLAWATWFAILYDMYGIHNSVQPARVRACCKQRSLPSRLPAQVSGSWLLEVGWLGGWVFKVRGSKFKVRCWLLDVGCCGARPNPGPNRAKLGQIRPNVATLTHHRSPLPLPNSANSQSGAFWYLLVPFGILWYLPARSFRPAVGSDHGVAANGSSRCSWLRTLSH